MAEPPKLLYVVVVDGEWKAGGGDGEDESPSSSSSFTYTRSVLQNSLQLMGCKARHAFKISRRVFEMMKSEHLNVGCYPPEITISRLEDLGGPVGIGNDNQTKGCMDQRKGSLTVESVDRTNSIPFELYKKLTTVSVPREIFLNVVGDALTQYKYVGPNQRDDLALACRIREKKESITILLCGTSGCGKSTLSSLLGSRLGITTVISTDSIRHMMRSFVDEKQNALLWSSTYHAGEHLDPVAVAKAKAGRRAKKLASISHSTEKLFDGVSSELGPRALDAGLITELISQKQMAIEGFKAQSEMVIDSLDRLITAWEHRKESVIVEGVHLSLNFVMGLMKKHPSIIPFMIYITNEDKHMERFAVRAKYMTLDPSKNKYVKYIRNIRAIQDYLCNRADKHLVPKVNNTNVDKSVAVIHATVFSCLRKRAAGEQIYDPPTNTVPLVDEEYRNQCAANSVSSKGMFQLIQRKGSSRHLMALLNTDGSVAKAWPVDSVNGCVHPTSDIRSEKHVGNPMYGPLQIGKAEPVNLQFGSFGISAWPSDAGGTSHTGSIDGSRADDTDTEGRYVSSCCSSPRMSEGPAKEPKEELSVSASDEEAEDLCEADTDEDLSDVDNNRIHEEMEGSVDEETKSDEEYDDLAIRDGLENGYWSDDDDEPYKKNKVKTATNTGQGMVHTGVLEADSGEKYLQNLDLFLKASESPPQLSQPQSFAKSGSSVEKRIKRRSHSYSSRFDGRPRNIPATRATILREAP